MIQAAQEAGIRLTLIRAAYFRAGFEQTLHAGQGRFCDPDVDAVLRDVAALQTWTARHAPNVRVALAAYAREQAMPFHMHVSEQRREVDECLAEHGLRPMQLLAEDGILDARFVAIHATHLDALEIVAFGAARAFACVCRITERDLGDGQPLTSEMLRAGARLCVGVDNHAAPDAFEEARAIELDERRIVALDPDGLLQTASAHGYAAIGQADVAGQDEVRLRADDPALAGAPDDLLTDAVMFGATARAVDEVRVGNDVIVRGGTHRLYAPARAAFERSLRRLAT